MQGRKPAVLTVIQGGIVDAPPPPNGLPSGAVDDWNTVTADLASRSLLTEATLGPVEMYVTALWLMRECRKTIEQYGMFVKTKEGSLKTNPASTNLQKAQDTVTRLAAELGLTPSSRSRKGLNGDPQPNKPDGISDFL